MNLIAEFIKLFLKLFQKTSKENNQSFQEVIQQPQEKSEELQPKLTKTIGFSTEDWITSSGKYPERAKSMELTDEVKNNAKVLLDLVNQFLIELGVNPDTLKISSGFRPSKINSSIPNASKKSLHMTGLAIDIEDTNNELDKLIQSRPELLDKYGLWLEHPNSTPGWTHLDKGTRSARQIRIFYP